jgi:hypothetical protein
MPERTPAPDELPFVISEDSHEGEQLTLSPAESDSMWDNYGG